MKSLKELDLKNQELEEDYAHWLKVNNQYTDKDYKEYNEYLKQARIEKLIVAIPMILCGLIVMIMTIINLKLFALIMVELLTFGLYMFTSRLCIIQKPKDINDFMLNRRKYYIPHD